MSLWSPASVPAGCEDNHSMEVQRQLLSGLIGLRGFSPLTAAGIPATSTWTPLAFCGPLPAGLLEWGPGGCRQLAASWCDDPNPVILKLRPWFSRGLFLCDLWPVGIVVRNYLLRAGRCAVAPPDILAQK